ncbi:sodium:proton antiporter [Alteromonas aestuariivivens]|uniref:Sodium:proton antiporter n=1 Tax=Alteromonas aestuariivivens TaxID=1938339 RepID=A0A3D8M4Z7_9ALTE|nr:monovalent cation/H(+) antiporter subunit G [Alteromonas aestuariivivens]RDV24650.1 sodium:proton antiporter [Alteromonas aestuariivivens]
MTEWVATVFIIVGCLLGVTGGIGLLRLPDLYSRLHAVSVTDTLCSFLILSGLALESGVSLASVKLLFIFLFLVFTSPTSSFAVANGAWQWGLRPAPSGPDTQENTSQ